MRAPRGNLLPRLLCITGPGCLAPAGSREETRESLQPFPPHVGQTVPEKFAEELGGGEAMASEASELELHLVEDVQLTNCMRLRVKSLQQKNEKPQDGEKLLRPNEFVYRVDFSRQHNLRFLRWNVMLEKPGKVDVIGTSQHWTPDLTHLMRRQLLEPVGVFWKKPDSQEVECNEADALEFGERLVELAKIRKVMYFLLAYADGLEPAHLKCSVVFRI